VFSLALASPLEMLWSFNNIELLKKTYIFCRKNQASDKISFHDCRGQPRTHQPQLAFFSLIL